MGQIAAFLVRMDCRMMCVIVGWWVVTIAAAVLARQWGGIGIGGMGFGLKWFEMGW